MNNHKILTFILFWLMSAYTTGISQNGFLKFILEDRSERMDIDDIKFKNDKLYVRGNLWIDSLSRLGSYVARLDTFGNPDQIILIYDTSLNTSILTNTPTRLNITEDNYILLPNYFFETNTVGLTVLDSVGNMIFFTGYPKNEFTIFPIDAFKIDSFYYMFGFVERTNYLLDDFIMKIDNNGNEVWFKHLGVLNLNEWLGAVTMNENKTFTISSTKFTEDYLEEDIFDGWRRPVLYTVDTTGTIIWQWEGEKNDPRTLGRGPFHHAPNGDWMIVSREFNYPYLGADYVWYTQTIARLDSSFNLIFRDTLMDFAPYYFNNILDMKYDPMRDEYILLGDKYFEYEDVESEIWVMKMNSSGEILWEISDTLTYHNQERHYTAGIAVSPSGSIYAAGYYQSHNEGFVSKGWLMKVTPDGCVDTLCDLTSFISSLSSRKEALFLYPNPAKDILYVKSNLTGQNETLQLLDLQGKILQQVTVIEGKATIQLNYPAGLYVIKSTGNNGVMQYGKFIISN